MTFQRSQENLTEVNPLHVDNRPGRSDTRYSFSRIALEDWDGNCSIPEVTVSKLDKGVYFWKYEGKPGVFIKEDKIMVNQDDLGTEAHRQAYFAASYLESQGLVEGWSEG